jgi:4-hydroxy-tetrahydrodipicolinate synthase
MTGKLEGIFTPMLVPFDDRGEINEAELRRLVRWLIAKGSHGIHVNGSTGEAARLTSEERQRIVAITCDEAAGQVPVIAGTAEPNTRESLRVSHLYAELGACAVAVLPPFYYRVNQDSVYTHFAQIARDSPLDIVLYNIPAFATSIDLGTVQKLSQFERVIGIKDSSGDLPAMMRLISSIRPLRPDFSFLTGWEPVLVPMLLAGCDGGTHASANVIPEHLRRMFEAVCAGEIEQAIRLQYQMLPLFDLIVSHFEFPDGFRAAAELRGFSFGMPRQPLSAAAVEQRSSQKLGLQLLLAGLGATP